MFPGQLPHTGDYHTLLHTQIYDYFLSMGMFSCAQSLLESDSNLRHKVMPGQRQHAATMPPPCSQSLLDSGLGTSYSSPGLGACSVAPENMLRPHEEPALLYEWFCTFWGMFESYQDAITGSSEGQMQDFATLPLNISNDCFPQPTSWQDPITFQPVSSSALNFRLTLILIFNGTQSIKTYTTLHRVAPTATLITLRHYCLVRQQGDQLAPKATQRPSLAKEVIAIFDYYPFKIASTV